MSLLSAVYGRGAALRRGWYARHPGARRRIDRPVISIGNLVVGGSGKTPAAAAIARLLIREGARPAILSRGYARRERTGGVLIVSDGARVLEPAARSGDEPQMLARALPGVPILVAPDRHRAAREAIARFSPDVLILDDGFQHVQLARDVDLLMLSPSDLAEQVLPAGVLREPLAAARAADALLVPAPAADVERIAASIGVRPAYAVVHRYDPPRSLTPYGAPANVPAGSRIVAVAGIARPHRFFTALRDQGWDVAREIEFRDHHWFSAQDVMSVEEMLGAASARIVMTTEKDAVRLDDMEITVPWAYLPMRVEIEPADAFAAWLSERVQAARTRRPDQPMRSPGR